jgi:uncharacterized protein
MRNTITGLICLLAANLAASPIPDFPFIAVAGRASREVAPDKAAIVFTVLFHAKESEEAVRQVNETLKALVSGLTELGVTEKDVRAHDLNKVAVREKSGDYNQLNILGYDVSREVKVVINDLKRYPAVIRRMMNTNNVTSVSSDFDVNNREQIEAELMIKACQDARKRADQMAKSVGTKVSGVFAVSDKELYDVGERFGFGYSGVFRDGAPPEEDVPVFVPSTIELVSNVDVLYRLDIQPAANKSTLPDGDKSPK